ncbi:MAG TPA: DUF3224 domain-containing protein [Longimicrobium sp.]|nr:DUF3224 domain-containing protein [Longimicrobium sp.]
MRTRLLACLLLLAAAGGARPLAAQPSAEDEVRQVVVRLFDAMRAGDSAAVRSVFHPTARLQSAAVRQGVPVLRTDSVEAFVRAVGTPHDTVWDERISNLEVRVDGELATAWMDYAFHVGPRFSHCGVNAFQLFRAADGWKVIQLTDTRRRQCAPRGASNNQTEAAVGTVARGTFEVRLAPQPTAHGGEGVPGRLSIDKTFSGDLQGTSKGEMLAAQTGVEGSAGYVAMERVTGTLAGRTGSFVLQHSGTMNRGAAQLTVSVVPDSGTDALAGLAGTMTIDLSGGGHAYTFHYTLPDPR